MKQKRTFGWCLHRNKVTTITAGMAREVCESCGHVTVRYVESAVQLFSTHPRRFLPGTVPAGQKETSRRPESCIHCRQAAVYSIPDGEVCDEHAWQAAARLDWEAGDIWVPIRIDRSTA